MSTLLALVTAVTFGPACGGNSGGNHPDPEVPDESVPGELLVGVRAGAMQSQAVQTLISSVGTVVAADEDNSTYRIALNDPSSVDAARAALAKGEDVVYVEPNYVVQAYAYADPNDAYWATEFGNAVKTEVSGVWAKTGPAWDAGTAPVVAVLDSGVKGSHASFAGALVGGYDLVTGQTDWNVPANIDDDNGHGTKCAGLIVANAHAAVTAGSGVGIASWSFDGTNGVPSTKVKVMPVKVLDSTGKGNHFQIAAGLKAAAQGGARIISMSFGGSTPSWTLQNAIQKAVTNGGSGWCTDTNGCIVIAAAGNGAGSIIKYPAAYNQSASLKNSVIAVGAVDNADALDETAAVGSNYGSWVDVLAPGVALQTPLAAGGFDNTYSGTSLSAAFVAGAAAMVWTNNPNMPAADLKALLTGSVDSYNRSKGKDIVAGGGRLNILSAYANAANGSLTRKLGSLTLNATNGGYNATTGAIQVPSAGTLKGTVSLLKIDTTTDYTVNLASSDTSVVVPSSVKIAKGTRSATFTATVGNVGADVTGITVTATRAGTAETSVATLDVLQPGLASVSFTSSKSLSGVPAVVGGNSITGTIALSAPAPKPNGTAVTLTFTAGGASATLPTPATITVPGGSMTAKFTIATAAVDPASPAVTVTVRGDDTVHQKSGTFKILPASVQGVSFSPTQVVFGSANSDAQPTVTGTVTLDGIAKSGGQAVNLISWDSMCTVPSSVTVAADAKTATFTATCEQASQSTTVSVTAVLGTYDAVTTSPTYNVGKSGSFKVVQPMKDFTVNASTILGAGNLTGTITLNDIAPNGGVAVDVTSDQWTGGAGNRVGLGSGPAASATVTVPAGQRSATFPITVSAGTTAVTANIVASFHGISVTRTVKADAPTVSTMTMAATSVIVGNPVTGTVSINSPAPTGGLVITLASSNANATVPGSVTISAGSTSTTFTITGVSGGTAIITAKDPTAVANSTAGKALNVNVVAASMSSITLTNNKVGGIQALPVVITLSKAFTADTLASISESSSTGAIPAQSCLIAKNVTSFTCNLTTVPLASDAAAVNITVRLPNGEYKNGAGAVTVQKTVAAVAFDNSATPTAHTGTDLGMTVDVQLSGVPDAAVTLVTGFIADSGATLTSKPTHFAVSSPGGAISDAANHVGWVTIVDSGSGAATDSARFTLSLNGTVVFTSSDIAIQ